MLIFKKNSIKNTLLVWILSIGNEDSSQVMRRKKMSGGNYFTNLDVYINKKSRTYGTSDLSHDFWREAEGQKRPILYKIGLFPLSASHQK